MLAFFFSIFAGVLTVATPCVLPVLPVILGGSLQAGNRRKIVAILLGLGISVFIFTLLLKASTAFIAIPPSFWTTIAAVIIILFAATLLFPNTWSKLSTALGFERSQELMSHAGGHKGVLGEFLLGMSLGPVFSSCSPTYATIVAVVLPAQFAVGVIYLLGYILGLLLPLALIAWGGQAIVDRLRWLANPTGWFRKALGLVLLAIGILIFFGIDKQIEAWLLTQGWLNTYVYEIPLQ